MVVASAIVLVDGVVSGFKMSMKAEGGRWQKEDKGLGRRLIDSYKTKQLEKRCLSSLHMHPGLGEPELYTAAISTNNLLRCYGI